MKLWHLIIREIQLRKLHFALGIVSVLMAVGVLTAEFMLLESHDLRTQQVLAEKQAQTKAKMDRMEDDYRKIMKKLGLNLVILPEDQKLADFYAEGYSGKDMPQENAAKLAESGIMTVRHLIPQLEQKIRWPEQGQRTIIIAGAHGEIPQSGGRGKKGSMAIAVARGSAVLGHEISDSLGLKPGDTITLKGRKFLVSRCHAERGTRDDITIWLDLAEAQDLLDREGRISMILALQCHCADSDLASLRREIGQILPGVKVIELASKVVTRAEARDRAKKTAVAALEAERKHRALLRAEIESFAAWLIPLVMVGAAAWIGLLSWMNVRERRGEIGILRTLGLRSRQIMTVFLARAFLIGLLGAAAGYGFGFVVGLSSGELAGEPHLAGLLFNPLHLAAEMLAAPLLALLASWPSALIAARQDPAVVLREE